MLIVSATIVTGESPNRVIPNQAVLISRGLIDSIGPTDKMEAAHPRTRRLDARGQLLMPGSICAHTHFYVAFARGVSAPKSAPGAYPEILRRLWWPLDESLSEEDIRVSASVQIAQAIRNGVTTLFDHHASSAFVDGSLDVIADVVERAGVRAVLCYEVSDRHGPASAAAGINENLRFLRRLGGAPTSLLAASFGLHASMTLSGATLQACRAAAPDEAGFHVHVAEHEQDEYDSLEKTGMRVVDRLNNHGILGPRTIAAHAVHVDAAEIALLKETHTWVTHQPRSNMNNAVGLAPVESMLRSGVKVSLGDDGIGSAPWEDWRAAYFGPKGASRDPRRMPASVMYQMAVQHAAELASCFFPSHPVGQVVPGAAADLILVDYRSPTPLTSDNFPWHVTFGLHSGMVTTTIVAGQVLMKDRELTTIDEAQVTARSRELATRVWKRLEEGERP